MSNNKYYGQAILYYPFKNSNYFTCSFLYSSFVDNVATYCILFLLWTTGAEYEIKGCNIVRSTHGNLNSYGAICTNGNLSIMDSCILENNANTIFYQDSSSYRITLSNSTTDKTTHNGYLTTQNTVTKSFILALNHMSTLYFHSEYDAVGYLTPIIQTPSSSKKQNQCYTGHKIFFLIRYEEIVSLISILILNFI
jgi:hypothetical protein